MGHDVEALIAVANEHAVQALNEEREAAGEPYRDEEEPELRALVTPEQFDRGLSRLAHLVAEKASIKAQAKAAIDRIRKREAALLKGVESGIAWWERLLADGATARRQALLGGGKKKSRAFISGVIGWREGGGRLEVTDEKALVAWLETQPVEAGLYRLEVVPVMSEIQKLAQGEHAVIPPGCQWIPKEDRFYAKPELPEGDALAKAGV